MRSRILTIAAMIIIAALTVPSAVAAPSKAATLKSQLDRLREDLSDAGNDYDRAYWKLDETDVRISKVDKRIVTTKKRLSKSSKLLSARVAGMYRTDPTDILTVLLGARSFEEMVTRLDYVQRIGRSNAEAIREFKELRDELSRDKEELEKERKERSKEASRLKKQRDSLQSRFSKKKAEYEKLQAEYARVTASVSTPSGPVVRGANGMVFPVQGVHYYSDTWGASRSGGRRSHKGTDIMSPRGTPCVAVLSGTVSSGNGGLGGKTIWLTADNGWRFYYAHLDGFAVASGRVSAGQTIGYVGSTGNASGGSPHLHFEIHPGGGGAVNPYPYLRQMQ
ncbi:MAG: peptidoglycan DD-metalloendopeptidase family protein [Coriobacteriia bacterium]|nr:peptidoglycan DD-metalloendopeptidase family protein [Coriobacteriia bacterium]